MNFQSTNRYINNKLCIVHSYTEKTKRLYIKKLFIYLSYYVFHCSCLNKFSKHHLNLQSTFAEKNHTCRIYSECVLKFMQRVVPRV